MTAERGQSGVGGGQLQQRKLALGSLCGAGTEGSSRTLTLLFFQGLMSSRRGGPSAITQEPPAPPLRLSASFRLPYPPSPLTLGLRLGPVVLRMPPPTTWLHPGPGSPSCLSLSACLCLCLRVIHCGGSLDSWAGAEASQGVVWERLPRCPCGGVGVPFPLFRWFPDAGGVAVPRTGPCAGRRRGQR